MLLTCRNCGKIREFESLEEIADLGWEEDGIGWLCPGCDDIEDAEEDIDDTDENDYEEETMIPKIPEEEYQSEEEYKDEPGQPE